MSENNEKKPILSIRDLVIKYETSDGVVEAVNGVSLDVMPGETLGLVGETGAGKTTIARSILRILPTPPASVKSGEILFQGNDLLQQSEADMRKLRGNKISMIFQDPMSALNPVLTVGDQIKEGISLHQSLSKGEATEKAVKMLEMVGIPRERFFDYPHQFSGGMKQRVVIAIALACNPALLLADEPTTALDVTIQAQVLELMQELREELGTSMIMISHDLGVIGKTCDKVAIIYAGSIVEYGEKRQVFKEMAHPYTLGLFDSLPSLTGNAARLKPIAGLMPNPMDLPTGCAFHPRCPNATDACKSGEIPARTVSPGHVVHCLNPVRKEVTP